jgi:hypothetical protein
MGSWAALVGTLVDNEAFNDKLSNDDDTWFQAARGRFNATTCCRGRLELISLSSHSLFLGIRSRSSDCELSQVQYADSEQCKSHAGENMMRRKCERSARH